MCVITTSLTAARCSALSGADDVVDDGNEDDTRQTLQEPIEVLGNNSPNSSHAIISSFETTRCLLVFSFFFFAIAPSWID